MISLPCGCRCANNNVYCHPTAKIGGKRFTAGEPLRRGRRCGSVITAVVGGRSMYGVVKRFVRIFCVHLRVYDFAVLSWLPAPVYPDADPLTVRIDVPHIDVNNICTSSVVSLNDIQPCRVLVEIDRTSLYMMRMEGIDTLHV